MKEKISLLLAGLVAGTLIGSLIPASAHHSDDFRALKRQVAQLRKKTALLDTSTGMYLGPVVSEQVLSYCEEGSSATWSQVTIEGLEDFRWINLCDTAGARPDLTRKQVRRVLQR